MNSEPEPGVVPIFNETIGGALIDAARINVMTALIAFSQPAELLIVTPGDEQAPPTIGDCLAQAAQWLDAARAMTIEQSEIAPTSLHVVGRAVGRAR